jgi:hypothetical protein
MSVGSGDWYVRARGRVLGPFNWLQLVSLRDRGQLSQEQEISQDRRSWIKAADVPGLFAPAGAGQGRVSTASNSEWPVFTLADEANPSPGSPAAEAAPSWYIARGDTHHGPLQLAGLQRMIDAGELGPSSLVWKDGMANWVPASQVPELRFTVAAGTVAGSIVGPAPYPGQAVITQSYAYQPLRTSGLAVASLVLGLLWLCGLGSLLATIFGAVALSQISRSNGTITGKGLALAGLILGILGLALAALSFGFLGAILEQARRPRWGP